MYQSSSVEYLDHMGSDLSVCNAARVSFGKTSSLDESGNLKPGDRSLLRFLAKGYRTSEWDNILTELAGLSSKSDIEKIVSEVRHHATHWSPFAHTSMQFRITAPLFVARQMVKHQIGLVWNEISRRYVDDEPTFYLPQFRKRAEDVKQGSGVEFDIETQGELLVLMDEHMDRCLELYDTYLKRGVAPEQARIILPQNMMTTWIWTGSVMAFARVCSLRLDPHAQLESQQVAQGISNSCSEYFPVSWKELLD